MKRNPVILIAVLGLLQLCNVLYSQPTAFTHSVHSLEFIEPVVPEPIDLQAVLLEDRAREQKIGPYRFAIQRVVNITPQTDGLWEEIDEDTLMWRLPIASPDAVSLNLGFTRYKMPPRGQLYIYSVDESQVIGPFTGKNNKIHGQLWTPLIFSDAMIVELTIPSLEVPELELELTSINHGYRGFNSISLYNVGDSDWCQRNVICPEGNQWRDQIRSVAFYYINGGASACSGSLINNTAQDGIPYLLTAFHCFDVDANLTLSNIEKEAIKKTMVVYWNYEAYSCSDKTPMVYSEGQSQFGADLIASYWKSDFALLELEETPPQSSGVYYAGWDRRINAPLSGAAIHHPESDLKKISIENNPLELLPTQVNHGDENNTILVDHGDCFHVLRWDVGITEFVSSGCPFFNSNKRIVGQLIGGQSSCDMAGPDFFGPLYRSWTEGGTRDTRLSDWLDPLNSGVTFLNGKNAEKDIIIGSGNENWIYPMYGACDQRTQAIYLASEIGSSGIIKSLALDITEIPGYQSFYESPVSGPLDDWTITMKHTSISEYEDSYFDDDDWTLVYTNDENIGSTGWHTFEFQTPFEYNGIGNLMVCFSHCDAVSQRVVNVIRSGACRSTNTNSNRSIIKRSDTQELTIDTKSGTRSFHIPNVKLTIEEKNRDKTIVIGSGDGDCPYPMFGASDIRTDVIYLASEIGNSGMIRSLALDVTTIPGYSYSFSDLPHESGSLKYWAIKMKHTSRREYTDTYFDNDSWTLVYVNDENIDATGWRMFDFQTPFEYNGTDNLMVQFTHRNGLARGHNPVERHGACRVTDTGTNRAVVGSSDTQSSPLISGLIPPDYCTSFVPNVKLAIRSSD